MLSIKYTYPENWDKLIIGEFMQKLSPQIETGIRKKLSPFENEIIEHDGLTVINVLRGAKVNVSFEGLPKELEDRINIT